MAIVGDIALWAGIFFMALTSIGLLRLPDFYTRAHAVSKSETLGMGLVVTGLILHEGASLVSLKLVLMVVFAFLLNPAAAHLLTRAAVRSGVQPWIRVAGRRTDRPGASPGD